MKKTLQKLIESLFWLYPKKQIFKVPFVFAKVARRLDLSKTRVAQENYWLDDSPAKRMWYVKWFYETLGQTKIRVPIPHKTFGEEEIVNEYRKSNKMIICSAHLLLNNVGYGHLCEKGFPIHQIANVYSEMADGRAEKVWGKDLYIPLFSRDPLCLLKARKLLKQGKVVATYIETPQEHWGLDTKNFMQRDIAGRPLLISTRLLQLASKTKTPVFFLATKCSAANDIEVHYKAYSKGYPQNESDVAGAVDEYVAFMSQHLEPVDSCSSQGNVVASPVESHS